MYLWARSWGIQPTEFWSMTMTEWWAEYEHNSPDQGAGKYAGKLTQADVDELREWIKE